MSDNPHTDDLLFEEIEESLRSSNVARSERVMIALPPIENFNAIQEVHRGGQVIVYEAMQQNPPRRTEISFAREI